MNKAERVFRRIMKNEARKALNNINIEKPKWMPEFVWKWLLPQLIKHQ